jgi:hypothetical protein
LLVVVFLLLVVVEVAADTKPATVADVVIVRKHFPC